MKNFNHWMLLLFSIIFLFIGILGIGAVPFFNSNVGLEIIEPIYQEKIKDLIDSFETAKANLLGSDDLVKVTKAVFENRVKIIFVEADKIIPGKINDSGEILVGQIQDVDFDDLLDDIAELVLKNRGEVVILSKEQIPGDTGVAAIYRY